MPGNGIDDGKIEIIGPDITDLKEGDTFPLGIYVQIAGREFRKISNRLSNVRFTILSTISRASCISVSAISPGFA